VNAQITVGENDGKRGNAGFAGALLDPDIDIPADVTGPAAERVSCCSCDYGR
jgi:hypothetical protein